jgi:limonene-1,2-epoxide hydrolase
MTASPESVVRRFLAAWEHPTAEGLASFFRADGVYVDGPRGEYHGIDAIKAEFEKQLAMGFDGVPIEVKLLVADGPIVMAERVDRFTLGGKTFAMDTVGVFEVDGDGGIKRFRDYYDQKSIADQVEAAGFNVGA